MPERVQRGCFLSPVRKNLGIEGTKGHNTVIAEEFGGKKLPRKSEKNLEKDRGERGFN